MPKYSTALENKLEKAGAIRLSETIWEMPQRFNKKANERYKQIEKRYAENTAEYLEKRRKLEAKARSKLRDYMVN